MPSSFAAKKYPVEVKGALVSEMLRVLAKDVSASAYAEIISHLTPDYQDAIANQRILAGSWYDVAYASEIIRAGYTQSSGVQERSHREGVTCVTNLLNGVHRSLIQVASPTIAIKNADIFFKNYYRGGVVEGVVHSETSGTITATGFIGITPELWFAISGGTEVVLQMAGAKNPRSRFLNQGPTQHAVSLFLEWSA